jgi:hypothetical protein
MKPITRAQREAIARKFAQSPSGAATYREFRKRAQLASFDGVVMLPWCGMWLGIERDGYTHS